MSHGNQNFLDKEKRSVAPENGTAGPGVPQTAISISPLSQEAIEMLADGELDGKERHDLLSQIDQTVDGWKHCALTFLESQMYKQTFQAPLTLFLDGVRGAKEEQTVVPSVSTEPSWEKTNEPYQEVSHRKVNRFPTGVLVTGLCLAMFFLGGIMTYLLKIGGAYEESRFATDRYAQQPSPRFISEGQPFPIDGLESPMPLYETKPVSLRSVKIPETEYVTLPLEHQSVVGEQVPCFNSREINVGQYLKMSPTVSPRELQQIQQSGGEVDIKRRNLVVPMKNGRHAVIPVDQIDVRYAPNKVWL